MKYFHLKWLALVLLFISTNSTGQDQNDINCSDNFNPVCGKDGNTYQNACLAELSDASIDFEGVCKDETLVCNDDFNPVCGKNDVTYHNSCFAAIAGIEIDTLKACVDDNGCPNIFEPVCGMNGRTYKNRCEANIDRVVVQRIGECDINNCPAIYSPVCGQGTTYKNACVAQKNGLESYRITKHPI